MTEKEFKKYEGKRTTGRVTGCDLEGGIIIGYDENDDDSPLLAIDDTSGWDSPSMNDVVIPNDKDRKDYFDGKHKYLWVRKNNVYIEKDLDLTSILRGCEGVELWSEICGKCKLDRINTDGLIRVLVNEVNSIGLNFLRDGRFYDFEGAKCLLWPSETNRDWSTFKKPVKVRDDDFVVGCNKHGKGYIDQYGEIDSGWKYIMRFEDWRTDLTEKELNKLNVK